MREAYDPTIPLAFSFPDGRYGRQVQYRSESGEVVAKLLLTDIKGLQLREGLSFTGSGKGKLWEGRVTSTFEFQNSAAGKNDGRRIDLGRNCKCRKARCFVAQTAIFENIHQRRM